MKRLWITCLCLLLALSVTACGNTPAASSKAESPAEAASETVSEPEQPPAPAEAEGSAASAEPVEYQPVMTEETAALIAEAAAAAGSVPSEEVPDSEKNDLWRFVESDEYQAELAELREYADSVLPGAEVKYDAAGNLLSVQDVVYAYPLDDGHQISICAPLKGFVSRMMSSYDEFLAFQVAASETNIDVEWHTLNEDAAETQLNLMFASGDLTDVVGDFLTFYSGTIASAYENDLIIPITDYLEDYSPNYNAWINSREDYLTAVSEQGEIFAWYNLMPEVKSEGTSWVRTDLLEQFGMESPITLEEYEAYFEQCVDAGLTATIYADTVTWSGIASGAYDLPGLGSSDGGYSLGAYHIGDTVYSAYQSENLRDYMVMMQEWYSKGFFSKDLVSLNGSSLDRSKQDELVTTGQVAYMVQGVDRYTNYKESAAVEGWDIEPSRNIVKEDGQITHFAMDDAISESNGSIVVTSSCEDIEAACRFVDWFYTDFGINTMNYGPEGVTWNWSSDGANRLFTAALYDDQVFHENAGSALMFYTGYMAWTSVTDPYSGMYFSETTKGIEAIEMYRVDNDSEYYLNEEIMSFTTEESDIVNSKLADMNTYIAENIVKFFIGEKSMSEWDDFLKDLDSLGIQDVVDAYQSSYDRMVG